jgi:hypothetical protein
MELCEYSVITTTVNASQKSKTITAVQPTAEQHVRGTVTLTQHLTPTGNLKSIDAAFAGNGSGEWSVSRLDVTIDELARATPQRTRVNWRVYMAQRGR